MPTTTRVGTRKLTTARPSSHPYALTEVTCGVGGELPSSAGSDRPRGGVLDEPVLSTSASSQSGRVSRVRLNPKDGVVLVAIVNLVEKSDALNELPLETMVREETTYLDSSVGGTE